MIIAHRGASKERPENTISAIERAIDLKVPFVEIDIRLSKDDIPVLMHDPSPARMMGIEKYLPIRQLSLEQIKAIDIFGESIPTLAEVLSLSRKDTGLMIEIKQGMKDIKKLVNLIFEVIETANSSHGIIIGSFSLKIMEAVKNYPRREQLGIEMIGIVEKPVMIKQFLDFGVRRLAVWHRLITPELIIYLSSQAVDVWVFTVDDSEMAKFYLSLGVQGIISNDPKNLLSLS